MVVRLAGSLALVAFALCLVIGGVEAGNTFSTTVGRAIVAMLGTLIVGLFVGHAGQRMVEDGLPRPAPEDDAAKPADDPTTGTKKSAVAPPAKKSQAKRPAPVR